MEQDADLKDVNGSFFTKDNVKVYTIYFENAADKFGAITELEKYFSQFGKISKLDFEKHYKTFGNQSKLSGTVQYNESESAYKALKFGHKNNYIVLPADSWKQPSQLNVDYSDDTTIQETNCSLMQLNEDCLLHIFSMLPFRDLIVLTNTFPVYKPNLKRFYKHKTIRLDDKEVNDLTLMQIRQFLIDFGDVIENLEIIGCSRNMKTKCIRYLNFALRFCKELKFLYIYAIPLKNKEFSYKISTKFHKLEKLILKECWLNNTDVEYFSALKNLKVLHLSGKNNSFSGECLYRFKNLKELNLKNCKHLTPKNFDIVDFSNLEMLNIIGCNLLDNSFRIISERGKKIKILKISLNKLNMHDSHFENFITEMGNLEQLIITNVSVICYNASYIKIQDLGIRLKKLTESNSLRNNLKVLHLTYFLLNEECFEQILKFEKLLELGIGLSHEDPIPNGFWQVIDSLKRLQTLCIEIDGFEFLDTEFIMKLIQRLRKKKSTQFFTLKADLIKRVYNEILQDPLYIESKNIVKVVPLKPFSIV